MKPKILQTLGMDILSGTGSPIRVLEISRNLAKRGFSVFATSLNREGKTRTHNIIDNVHITRTPFVNIRTEEARFIVNTHRLYSLNKQVIKDNGIDIMHSHLISAAFASFFLKKKFRIPYIYDMHGLFPEERIIDSSSTFERIRFSPWKIVERFLRKSASYIVATSDTMMGFLKERGYNKVESVPVGVDTDFFAPKPKNTKIIKKYGLEGKRIVMYTGNTNRYQGMDDLLDTIPYVINHDKNTVFMIVGGGQELGFYIKKAESLGISKNTIFTGPLPYSIMPDMLSVADICLSLRASTFTGNMTFPTKLTAYMSSGKPSVCTRTGDQERILEKHNVGVLADSGNPRQIADAIISSLSSSTRLKRMGRTARKVALQEFSWDVLCERYIKIYKKTL